MATYNDGSIPYGVGETITGGATTYVIEDFSVDLASTVIERRDGVGVMSGRVVIDDQPATNKGWTASLTLQRAIVTDPIPDVGDILIFETGDILTNLGLETDGGSVIVISSSGSQSQTTAHSFTIRVSGVINY